MRIFSGIQPTGELHIGNYLGMVKQSLDLQEKAECIFSIVDLHAITIPYQPENFQSRILETAVAYLAVGFNPEKSIIYIQSQVKEHTELCWLLGTITPVGELQRMTQYKEKSKQFKKAINAGLLNYPILQAADILLYQTDLVPVGKDQQQHVELARTIARKFNQRFGKTFVEPKVQIPKVGAKIMALNNPKKKMSKSLGPQSYISLFEEPEEIKKKIMAAVTDTGKVIKYSDSKPGISNLLTIYSLFTQVRRNRTQGGDETLVSSTTQVRRNRTQSGDETLVSSTSGKSISELEKNFKGKGYEEFKKSLTKLLINSLEPFRRKRKELLSREVYIKEILNAGAKRAKTIAQLTLEETKKKMGLS